MKVRTVTRPRIDCTATDKAMASLKANGTLIITPENGETCRRLQTYCNSRYENIRTRIVDDELHITLKEVT